MLPGTVVAGESFSCLSLHTKSLSQKAVALVFTSGEFALLALSTVLQFLAYCVAY
jgi:hypothetical protein